MKIWGVLFVILFVGLNVALADEMIVVSADRLAELEVRVERLEKSSRSPKIAYDSGWRETIPGWTTYLEHNVGGNTDRYIVILDTRDPGQGQNNFAYGIFDDHLQGYQGIYYHHLTNTSMELFHMTEDVNIREFRVRIITY